VAAVPQLGKAETLAATPAAHKGAADADVSDNQDEATMRWRRKVAPSVKAKQQADQQADLAKIKAHFHEASWCGSPTVHCGACRC
jgi:hypothetical protein